MMLANGNYCYEIELDEDTYWALTKLGAELRMHQKAYVEKVLKEHAETVEYNRDRESQG